MFGGAGVRKTVLIMELVRATVEQHAVISLLLRNPRSDVIARGKRERTRCCTSSCSGRIHGVSRRGSTPTIERRRVQSGAERCRASTMAAAAAYAGDTLRTAADLRVPLVGVKLLSRQGHFRRVLDGAGRQSAHPAEDVRPGESPYDPPFFYGRGGYDDGVRVLPEEAAP